MKAKEFNTYFASNIEEGYYGLAIDTPIVVSFLFDYFKNKVKEAPELRIHQIKSKWSSTRVYTSLPKAENSILEEQIDILLNKKEFNPIIED